MNSALLSSKKMDYCTPQGFFDTLNAEFHFTLDAAATEKSAKCKNFYTPETDGLTAPWNIGGGSRIAAYEVGVDFIGFEIDPIYYAAEEQRFLDYTSQTSLFHLT